eukprot:CAMPEP_0198241042 /NCGR_PEP_ID=MMETSP1446-20131203/5972_1 /TAXON_ID=1461542 ORGANISM="Unidentified sp, Strain CCMP2111" /NCGR_SAMPLE_ID=MMETSP1446 /ASSEMBLY_ACC=CAM_ASM_001112 /LENGTH=1259 /DNA_ID=CAMNT_0043923839 /DNA_START=131 /DNA_END=3907 /DNA_ORIENTATION=-
MGKPGLLDGGGAPSKGVSKSVAMVSRIREENEGIGRALDDLADKVQSRGEKWVVSPVSFLDAIAAQQARALRDEKKRKDKKQEVDFQKIASNERTLAAAANAAGVSKEVLKYAMKTFLSGPQADDDNDKRSIFWKIMDDYFRSVSKEDLCVLRSLVLDPVKDPAFKVPPMGKKYWLQWQDEEKLESEKKALLGKSLSTAKTSKPQSESSAGKSAKGVDTSPLISTVLCPKEDGTDLSEMCDVCFEGESTEDNMIIFCESCNVAVHQACYGVSVIPAGPWLCRKCETIGSQKQKSTGSTPNKSKPDGKPHQDLRCALCPVRHGALKPAATPSAKSQKKWVHLFCSQWMPETFIRTEDTAVMEPVQNLQGVSRERFKLLCSICKQKYGACIQCSHGHCAVAFHPLCARAANMRMEVEGREGQDGVNLKAYCQKHAQVRQLPAKQQQGEQLSTDGAAADTNSAKKEENQSDISQVKSENTKADTQQLKKGAPISLGSGGSAQHQAADDRKTASAAAVTPLDLLDEVSASECATLLRQTLIVFGVKPGQVAKSVGVDGGRLANFHKGVDINLTEGELASMRSWVRGFGNSLYTKVKNSGEPKTEPTKKNDPKPSSSPRAADAAKSASQQVDASVSSGRGEGDAADAGAPNDEMNQRHKQNASSSSGSGPTSASGVHSSSSLQPRWFHATGVVPKRFGQGLDEYTHIYTSRLLGEAPHATPSPSAGSEKVGKGNGVCESDVTRAMAISPDNEITGELFMVQQELLYRMASNRQMMVRLVSEMSTTVPKELGALSRVREDAKVVEDFLEASREAKRVQKRERRAEMQKETLAAAEAAVANSSRYRKADDIARYAEQSNSGSREGTQELEEVVDIFTKDENDRDVIYDRFAVLRPDQDVVCCVCGDGQSEAPNQIVFCEMCDQPVHQQCYGISEIPDGEWLCWPCKEYEQEMLAKGTPRSLIRRPRWQGGDHTAVDRIQCALCPAKRGALKKTGNAWVHVACCLANPMVEVLPHLGGDKVEVTAAGGIDRALADGQTRGPCVFCKGSGGARVRCNHGNCQALFHPLCARAAGNVMTFDSSGKSGVLAAKAYCLQHGHMVQQQQQQQQSSGPAIPKILQDHILWLERNFSKLRRTREELERLRIICDVVIKREKTKANLCKAEKAYIAKSLNNPKMAAEFERKLASDQRFMEDTMDLRRDAVELTGKRKVAGWSSMFDYGQTSSKRMKASQHHYSNVNTSTPMVDRERIMTADQAQATNKNLPAGYL